jgi:hypothetical protein
MRWLLVMIDRIFDLCVVFLVWLSQVTGTTYKQINVIVFCILWPIFTLALVLVVVLQQARIARLRKAAGGEGCRGPEHGV